MLALAQFDTANEPLDVSGTHNVQAAHTGGIWVSDDPFSVYALLFISSFIPYAAEHLHPFTVPLNKAVARSRIRVARLEYLSGPSYADDAVDSNFWR